MLKCLNQILLTSKRIANQKFRIDGADIGAGKGVLKLVVARPYGTNLGGSRGMGRLLVFDFECLLLLRCCSVALKPRHVGPDGLLRGPIALSAHGAGLHM